ncbi:hypothetical protein RGU72_15525 [Undibacterium sp. 5I1]|uniref:hypothetical protein n=1 Tax=unclassified Undibacterium TaxID=2630295 RepID=UPI002AB5C1D0|nr:MULTISPECIES: hypothetical protein [unclassified Undibacterium]MDY7539663.1 hypothetical protein [Undibacterium sp. 5I1]MEB0232242.1 hypothetical protein [Undibacterium sp. 10I3]
MPDTRLNSSIRWNNPFVLIAKEKRTLPVPNHSAVAGSIYLQTLMYIGLTRW